MIDRHEVHLISIRTVNGEILNLSPIVPSRVRCSAPFVMVMVASCVEDDRCFVFRELLAKGGFYADLNNSQFTGGTNLQEEAV